MRITAELRLDRKDQKGRHPLQLRSYGAGKVSVGAWVHPRDWDAPRQRVRLGAPAAQVINDKVKAMVLRMEEGIIKGVKDLPAYVRSKGDASTLAELWTAWIQKHSSRYEANTLTAMRARMKNAQAFDPGARLTDIDRSWMLRYIGWQRKQFGPNTIIDQCKRVRIIVDTLRREQGLPALPELRRLDLPAEETAWKHLGEEEFRRLEKWKLPARHLPHENKWWTLAHDLWLFSLYTGGMRFGDLVRVDRTWIRGDHLEHRNSKPPFTPRLIPLLPEAKRILARYPGKKLWNPIIPGGGTRVRVSGNVMLNRALKDICAQVGIDRPVSMNWARKSCAEFLYMQGVDIRTIAMLLGNTPATLEKHYLLSFNRRKAGSELKRAFGKRRSGHR